jgi:hypothetical protein
MEKLSVTALRLCKPCYETRKQAGARLVLVKAGRDNKIRCDGCGKMRYGAIYDYQFGEG